MDRELAYRLENEVSWATKIREMGAKYIDLGNQSLNYYLSEFDAAHDVFQCYAPLTRNDLELMDRGMAKTYIMPNIATQLTTMATFIAQVLFGGETPNRVEARTAQEELNAENMNQLLMWNSEQQPVYELGYLWVLDVLIYNRGIFFEHWEGLWKSKMEPVEGEDPDPDNATDVMVPTPVDKIDPQTGEKTTEIVQTPTKQPATYTKFKKTKEKVGGFNKVTIVSPYDFVCDPVFPLCRFNEGRFAGHKTLIPWIELEARSKLPVDDPAYVSPRGVENLKTVSANRTTSSSYGTTPQASTALQSRTRYDRTRSPFPVQVTADKNDHGIVECYELRVKISPKDYDISDDEDISMFTMLIGNAKELLSIDPDPYLHDEYPYSVGEGRPSAHYQFSPGWALFLKPIQDQIDALKNKHQEAQARSIGNIFVYDPDKVDAEDFTNPDKIGVMIPIKPNAVGTPLNECVMQLPLVDFTKDFVSEIKLLMDLSQASSGVTDIMQGDPGNPDTPATTSVNAQQMAAGRLTSIARMLSVQALVPQTRRFVSNFQQFLDSSMVVRLRGNDVDFSPVYKGQSSTTISRDTIQGDFDLVAHDGSLPGTDTRKIAAGTKVVEASQAFPQYFDDKVAGNIDLKDVMLYMFKSAGFPIQNFLISPEAAQQNAAATVQGMLQSPQGSVAQPPNAVPPPHPGISGDRVPIGPNGQSLPNTATLPKVGPPQVRPQHV